MSNQAYQHMLTIGIVAGEVSGDALGGDFMAQMNAIHPNIRWVGVGGSAMQAQGLTSVIDMTRLSVMGLSEVITHLPDLLRAKKQILTTFGSANIDIFVGIDAPDFNLRLGKALKKSHPTVYCVQYVSPSIWAWRENRIYSIMAATDLVLCLFPFELDIYAKYRHPAVCVGHPLLSKLSADTRTHTQIYHDFLNKFSPQFAHLSTLKNGSAHPICVMAGSRKSEINAILPLLIGAMDRMDKQGNFAFILPVVSDDHAALARSLIDTYAPTLSYKTHIVYGQTGDGMTLSQQVMNASELILLASGTATLEALLLHRPMVVVYKVKPITYAIAKRLIKIPYYSLPNILAYHQSGAPIVPELIQDNAHADRICYHVLSLLADSDAQRNLLARTTALLRQDSHHNSANVVLEHYYQKHQM